MGWFSKAIDRVTGASRRMERHAQAAVAQALSTRRWESAKTDRLNQAHWAGVNGQPINADLNSWLTNLRHRCEYEVANNSLVEGIVNTYQLCVVGSEGPRLSLLTQDQSYADKRAAVWSEWSIQAGSNQQLSLVEILDVWIRDLFGSGEFLSQMIDVPDVDTAVKMRLLPIHSHRLMTPPWALGQPDVALGVRRDLKNRRPLSYTILQPWVFQAFEVYTGEFKEIPYADMIHGFRQVEEDQVRGVPWLAGCLDAIAALRDFKIETLDAARAAADWSVLLTTTHPDAPFFQVNETTDTERRTIRHVTPGWDAKQMSPSHPGPLFVPFYEALAREIGGPVAMPLMMILLDSSSSNYSSARFDGQMFWRGVAKTQGWLGRILARIESQVALEAERAGVLSAPPVDLTRSFIWPKAPHVDPVKESTADRIRLQNGEMSYSELCASHNKSVAEVIATRKRDNEALAEAGLPPIPGIPDPAATAAANQGTDDSSDDEPPQPKTDGASRNGHSHGRFASAN